LKVVVPWPSRDEERRIVRMHGNRTAMPQLDQFGLERLTDLPTLQATRATVAGLQLADEVADYIVDLVRETREHPALLHGASPRAAAMLATASRALAVLRGRNFVLPDDVKELFMPAMRHRVVLAPGAEVEGLTTHGVLEQVLSRVSAPR
jgi:MoxR-like ATPase